jgi:hypothetical protein
MRKRKVLFLCLGAGLLLTVVVWAVRRERDREPTYDGRKLSEWVDLWPQKQDEASDAIHHIGTNTFPVVLKWLRSGPSPWKAKMLGRVITEPDWMKPDFLVDWLSDDEAKKCVGRAYKVVRILGEKAGSIAPELQPLSYDKSPFVGAAAFDALAYTGPAGLPHLLRAIRDPRNPFYPEAVRRLSMLLEDNPAATNILEALIQCEGDKDVLVQKEASRMLAQWASRQPAGAEIDEFKRSVGSTNEVFLRALREFEIRRTNSITNPSSH